jgi:histone demethylase JARID1
MYLEKDELDINVEDENYKDMIKMVEIEKKMRKSLLEWGVTEAEREEFELMKDDERKCDV